MIAELIAVPVESDRFEGLPGRGDDWRTFGGVIAAQALSAAAATALGRPCHSMHLLFVGAGDGALPITLAVERLRDGAGFTARSVRVEQKGRLLAMTTLSFHAGDEGPRHQIAMPQAPDPETLEDQREMRRRKAAARGKSAWRSVEEELVDARPAALSASGDAGEVTHALWFRSRVALGDDPLAHQALIAFASDIGPVRIQLLTHDALDDGQLDAASLDHGIWFHRPARADEWLLYIQRAPVAHGGRGFTTGAIYTRDGALVASVAQEVLMRRKRAKRLFAEGIEAQDGVQEHA